MADFKQIEINGTAYTVKDETARTAAETANTNAAAAIEKATTAVEKATTNETNISNLAAESLVAKYLTKTETIQFTKGISYTVNSKSEVKYDKLCE